MGENNNRILKELVKFVREQREINKEQKKINLGVKEFIQQEKKLHLEFAKAMVETNRRQEAMSHKMDKFMMESEKRFRMFYDRIVKLEQRD